MLIPALYEKAQAPEINIIKCASARPSGKVCEKCDAICDRYMHVVGIILMNGVRVCMYNLIRHVSVCNNCVQNTSCRHMGTRGSAGNVVMHVRHVHVSADACR